RQRRPRRAAWVGAGPLAGERGGRRRAGGGEAARATTGDRRCAHGELRGLVAVPVGIRQVTSVILATGSERRSSLGLAAAVAVEAARLTETGVLLIEVGEAAQRRGRTLLAAPD